MRIYLLLLRTLFICLMCEANALAAPDEITVYTDEMNNPGEFVLEQHLNYTIKGARLPNYPGQIPSQHLTQATSEFSYGISENLETAFYVPLAFTADGYSYLNGLSARLKYIAPKQNGEKIFYGINVEVGRESLRTSESLTTIEFRPIIGFHDAKWLLSFNPILSTGLTANVSHQLHFDPALKLSHIMGEGVHCGFEYYGNYGSLNRILPGNQLGHTLYAVVDAETHGIGINFGIGRGFVNAADTWVMKGIIALPFD